MAFRSAFAFVLAVIVVLAVISIALFVPNHGFVYFHLATLALVGGGMLLLSFVNYSPGVIVTSLRTLFSPAAAKKKDDYDHAARIFRTMSRYAWAIAGILFLVGLIKLQLQLTRPEHIAPNLSFSLSAILYGLFWGEVVCGLCETQAAKGLAESGQIRDSSDGRWFLFSIAIIVFIVVLFSILWDALLILPN